MRWVAPHELRSKKCVPVMLMRNVKPIEKYCDCKRLLVDEVINDKVLMAIVAETNRVVFLPSIPVSPTKGLFPFNWRRRRFPIRVVPFAIAINNYQGRTLKRVVIIDLLVKAMFCYTHGQRHVAASRVGDLAGIRFSVNKKRCLHGCFS